MITGEVSGIAFGGEGIIRQDGLVIFVPFTAPGDTVECRITQKKKNFARAELVKVISPSGERISPRCPYFGVCGGCQLQHLDYRAQLEYKRQFVVDALERIGHLDASGVMPTIAAEGTWAYRRHVTFHIREGALGYIATDNKTLLEVSTCPIFVESDNTIVERVRKVVKGCTGRVTVLKMDDSTFALHFQLEVIPQDFRKMIEAEHWPCVIVSAPKESFTLGSVEPHITIDGMSFTFSPKAFIQNHPEQSGNIYRYIHRITRSANPKSTLDLYCGIGISTLLIAREGIPITGIEFNAEAIALAKKNGAANGISNVEFLQGDVKALLPRTSKRVKPELIIVNPPRTGMDPEVVQGLLKTGAKDIVYISCMPSTLARDLKVLCEKYLLKSCQPFDMFPQTSHVETVVHLQKKTDPR